MVDSDQYVKNLSLSGVKTVLGAIVVSGTYSRSKHPNHVLYSFWNIIALHFDATPPFTLGMTGWLSLSWA